MRLAQLDSHRGLYWWKMDTELKCCAYDAELNPYEIIQILDGLDISSEDEIRALVNKPNRIKYFKLFEYTVAHKFGAITWENIPAPVKKIRRLPIPDKGIDCVTPDLSHAIQVKWYRPGSYVQLTEIATFYALGSFMNATRLTVVTSEGVRLSPIQPPGVEHLVISNSELAQMLINILHAYRPMIVEVVDAFAIASSAVVKAADAFITATNVVDEPLEMFKIQRELSGMIEPPENVEFVLTRSLSAGQPAVRLNAPKKLPICSKCDKTFKDMRDLARHEARARPCRAVTELQVICTSCGNGFNSKKSMQRHLRTSCKHERIQQTTYLTQNESTTGTVQARNENSEIAELRREISELSELIKTQCIIMPGQYTANR